LLAVLRLSDFFPTDANEGTVQLALAGQTSVPNGPHKLQAVKKTAED
jgi:hypothetical protein